MAHWPLALPAPVAHAHAEGHRELLDARKPRGGHHRGHLLAADEGVDALGQILVRPGLVAADQRGRARQDLAEVEVVEPAEQAVGREGEFQNDEATIRAEDAVELPKGGGGVGDVADAEGDGDDVGGLIGQGE